MAMIHRGWDFHFGILGAKQHTLYRIRSYFFVVLSMPSDSGGPRRDQSRPFRVQENQELPYFEAISPTSLRLPLISTYSRASRRTYPVSSGSAAIRPTILPNSRLVR